MAGPLNGIKILDFTWALAGPYGTMLLADLGAEVIKVEIPDGDRARFLAPKVEGMSTYFFSANRGKQGIILDLKTAKGHEIAIELAKLVDVVAENFTAGTMDKLGLGYEELRKHNPRLIYAGLSGFGVDGPYSQRPAMDSVVQAMGGLMSVTGFPGGPPVRVGTSIGDMAGGMFLAMGVMAALIHRGMTGEGQMLDLALLDCQVPLLENAFVRHFATGEVPERVGNRHPVGAIHGVFPTKDGHVAIVASGGVEQWAVFLETIGRIDVFEVEKYHDRGSRVKYINELEPIINDALQNKTTAEWVEAFEAVGIGCGPVNNIAQVARDPQLNHRRMFVDVPFPPARLGHIKVANTPFKYSATPSGPGTAAPAHGEHTASVLSRMLGLSESEIALLVADRITTPREHLF